MRTSAVAYSVLFFCVSVLSRVVICCYIVSRSQTTTFSFVVGQEKVGSG